VHFFKPLKNSRHPIESVTGRVHLTRTETSNGKNVVTGYRAAFQSQRRHTVTVQCLSWAIAKSLSSLLSKSNLEAQPRIYFITETAPIVYLGWTHSQIQTNGNMTTVIQARQTFDDGDGVEFVDDGRTNFWWTRVCAVQNI